MRISISIHIVVMIIIIVLFPSMADAQPPIPGGGSGNVSDAPVDGGLSLLIAAGVGYGAKKIREKRKNQDRTEKTK